MKKLFLALLILVGFPALAFAPESLTITTYYPAPYGVYQDLIVYNRVGIGNTNPARALYVGNATAASAAARIAVDAAANQEPGIEWYIAGNLSPRWLLYRPQSSTDLRLFDGADRVTFQVGGNVGIGTASPAYTLDVNGSFRATGANVYFTNLGQANTTPLFVSGTGLVTRQLPSSRRYKHDIKGYEPALDKINKLRPVRFKWNEDTGTPNKKDFGLVAEEVNDVFPELVMFGSNGQIESVDYMKLSVILLKGIQEQQKEIANLQKEISILKKSLTKKK